MLKVNSKEVKVNHFPDGTQCLRDMMVDMNTQGFVITWSYENDEECMTLWYIVNHIRQHRPGVHIILKMLYIPNARMDRTKYNDEVFTLRYFADFINALKFDKVYVLDPHSDVSVALFNNVEVLDSDSFRTKAVMRIATLYEGENNTDNNSVDMVFYFPDAGAMKRYDGLFTPDKCYYGNKRRDWITGKITGLYIMNHEGLPVIENELEGKVVVMFDDIVSFGGTLAYSADKLSVLGAKDIYACATHTENNVLDEENGLLLKRLRSGVVKKLYTTDSIYTGPIINENIEIIL